MHARKENISIYVQEGDEGMLGFGFGLWLVIMRRAGCRIHGCRAKITLVQGSRGKKVWVFNGQGMMNSVQVMWWWKEIMSDDFMSE